LTDIFQRSQQPKRLFVKIALSIAIASTGYYCKLNPKPKLKPKFL